MRVLLLIITIDLFVSFAHAESPLRIVVSINPYESVLRSIAGEKIQIDTLVGAGADPHTFELKVAHLRVLELADLVVLNGRGLEFWTRNLEPRLAGRVIYLASVDSSGEQDLHVWLDPQNVMRQSRLIAETLCRIGKGDCNLISQRANNFIAELKQLDLEIEEEVSHWRHKEFIAYHPAWTHFARRYVLKQLGVLFAANSREVTASHFRKLVDLVRTHGIKAFWLEPNVSHSQVQGFLDETGLATVVVDDIGHAGESYIGLMRRNLRAMSKVMREKA